MSRKNKRPQTVKQKEEAQKVTTSEAVVQLKEEILEEVKRLSRGQINTVYALTQMGRELIELETAPVGMQSTTKAPETSETALENEF